MVVDTSPTYLQFFMFMLDYISVTHVFTMFSYHFGIIYGTNLLTRCPVPVPVFCCLFVSEKLFGEVFSESVGNLCELFSRGNKDRARRKPTGGPTGTRRPPSVAHTLAAPGPHLVPSGVVSSCPVAYKFVFDTKTLSTRSYFFRRRLRPPPSPTLV